MKRILIIALVGLFLVSIGVFAQQNVPQKIKVVFWHAMPGTRVNIIQRMVDDFNLTHPDIQVTAEYKGTYRDTLNATEAAVRAGTPPTVIQSFEIGTQQLVDMGVFVPIQDLIKKYGLVVPWSDYIDAALNYYRVGGKLYAMPWNSSNAILYYNKTLLAKAGVTMPKKPTFQDIIDIGRKIVKSGVAPAAITWALHSWFFEQWMAEQGVNLVNNNNGRTGYATEINLLDPAAIRIMKWWKQLYDEGLWVNPGRENWAQARQNFVSQRCAMLISSTSDVTRMENAAFTGGWKLGTAFLPVPAEVERHGVVLGGGALWIVGRGHSDAELKAATEFVVWMTQDAQTIRWHQETGYFAIRKSALQDLEMEGWFRLHPNYRTAFDQLQATQLMPATQGAMMGPFPEARTYIEDAVESILNGTPIQKALTTAKQKTDQALADYIKVVGK